MIEDENINRPGTFLSKVVDFSLKGWEIWGVFTPPNSNSALTSFESNLANITVRNSLFGVENTFSKQNFDRI